jgi:hypothetical protein
MMIFAIEVLRGGDLRPVAWLLRQPLFWAVLGVVFGPYLFSRGFQALQLKRRIMNIPRSTTRGAALGLVEVSGKAVGPYKFVAPLSKEDCLYYRLVVVNDPDKKFANRIREACAPFFVDDGTGTLMVYPPSADLRLNPSHQLGSLGQAMEGYKTGSDAEFVQEFTIRPGDPIFVFGTLMENAWAGNRSKMDVDGVSRIGPGFVSRCEADLLRHQVFQFLDPTCPAGEAPGTSQSLDLYPPAILMKGKGPFLISSESQRDLLTKLGWKSLLCIWGGPIAALWGLWELLVVRPGLIGSPLVN